MRIETLAVHAGSAVDPATGAVTPAIHPSTTFEREPDGSFPHGHIYSRSSAPNRAALEACLTALEGGAGAAAFSSASAATSAIFQALAPGDHVVAPTDAYYGTGKLLREVFGPWGLETTFVDMTDLGAVQKAIRPHTRLVWAESPSNPLWKVSDLKAIGAIAHAAGARYVCDNTTATPVLQSPFTLGADVILHATTKYLGGHGDVLGGILVTRARDAFFDRLRLIQTSGGAVPSPFDCWLVIRGIRTLPYRVRAQSEHALRVASFLAGHPRVEAVHYPGLATHAGHAIATRQMRMFGGMLSVQVRGGADAAMAVAAKLRVFTRATSFGGTESLIEHRASIEGPGTATPQNLLRVSIGLEHPDDLVDDLAQALGA
ncbi:MAG TPA: aminotransferase class V-fold PLP-dependent enzyme [Methylomirabilota bacterium]|jgi:cystathionine gamma-synthase|nr:aminotransferase class V-fold PLP-dependent enzyme [Methylomirabilota bacterium]